jgi:hypothetical protein
VTGRIKLHRRQEGYSDFSTAGLPLNCVWHFVRKRSLQLTKNAIGTDFLKRQDVRLRLIDYSGEGGKLLVKGRLIDRPIGMSWQEEVLDIPCHDSKCSHNHFLLCLCNFGMRRWKNAWLPG